MTLYEVDEAASRIRQEVDPDANIIVGATFDEQLGDRLRVSIVASGMIPRVAEQRAGQGAQAPRSSAGPQGPSMVVAHQAPQPEHSQHAANSHVSGSYVTGPHGAGSGAIPPPPGDLQRRLSEALQSPTAVSAQNFSPPVHNESARQSRDSWIAPGNVMIEDGLENFPPLSGNALLRTPPLPSEGAAQSHGPRFEPQAPAEIQRTSRRLPGIEDFPPQAQKEWNAHHGRSSRSGGRDAEEPRKPGLLERFAGLARK
jgi:cell division protein FtsZ